MGCVRHEVAREAMEVEQAVFVQPATPGPLSIDLVRGELAFAPAGLQHAGAFTIGNRVFPLRWEVAETRLRSRDVGGRLSIRGDALYFEGRPISLRGRLRPRSIWQAIEWHDWVICLARTSSSDGPAQAYPPRFATELLTFRRTESVASVVWLAPDPPGRVGIFVLDRQRD